MVVETVGRCPAQAGAAEDAQVVAHDVDARAEGVEAGRDPREPVMVRGATRWRRGSQSCRGPGSPPGRGSDLVDRRRDVRRTELDRPELGRTDRQVGAGLPTSAAPAGRSGAGRSSIRAPIERRMSMTAPRRVDADVPDRERGVIVDRTRNEPEGGRRHVAGNQLLDRAHRPPSFDRPGHHIRAVEPFDGDPPGPEHPLRVIPGRDRLANCRPPPPGAPQEGSPT